ncbi:LysR family transcriptional regulator [Chiayiivirga flava]|uniref:DNA-binding transcriptional LysR family regulator n=1 Tax=Chiayiivirga flava TaxID=659595 RepID=A0A7W8D838_9GAMM|nr:LysR family transcriptional regulator [Chiayiivirga flava]MBB5208411.1 DNA-binding transcriptional LysR family regulator [Chiayiivirga flava]
MDRIGDIALFLRVLDLGSISAAARSLDLSTAVASQRLKRLETSLGVRLLHRTTRRLHATPEGALLAEQGRGLVQDLESLGSGLRDAGAGVAGTLRVTMSASFGRQYISPLLPRFLARHPRVRVSVHLTDQVVDLVSEGFDLAIRIGDLHDSSLVSRRLALNRRVLCASPSYLAAHGTPDSPQDLTRHECLVLVGSAGRHDMWRLRAPDGGGETVVRVRGRCESNYGELLRDAAVAGLGIALHSTWHVGDDLRAGRLRIVLPQHRPQDTGIHAVMPQRRLVPPRVRAFVDFLAQEFADEPAWDRDLLVQLGVPPPSAHAYQR